MNQIENTLFYIALGVYAGAMILYLFFSWAEKRSSAEEEHFFFMQVFCPILQH